MNALITFITAHSAAILGALFFVSEALALIPGVQANSVFQFIFGLLAKSQAPKA